MKDIRDFYAEKVQLAKEAEEILHPSSQTSTKDDDDMSTEASVISIASEAHGDCQIDNDDFSG